MVKPNLLNTATAIGVAAAVTGIIGYFIPDLKKYGQPKNSHGNWYENYRKETGEIDEDGNYIDLESEEMPCCFCGWQPAHTTQYGTLCMPCAETLATIIETHFTPGRKNPAGFTPSYNAEDFAADPTDEKAEKRKAIKKRKKETIELLEWAKQQDFAADATKGATYSWTITYDSTTESPFGDAPKMPLWLAIIEANASLEDVKEGQEDFYQEPEVEIDRYIDGQYDGNVELYEAIGSGGAWEFSGHRTHGFEDWEQVIEWAEDQYTKEEWDAVAIANEAWRQKHAKHLKRYDLIGKSNYK